VARTPPPAPAIDGVRIAVVGTILWGVAFLAALADYVSLAASGRSWWVTTAGVGVLLGLIGIGFVRRFGRDIAAR
jgi:hypothetical protein